MKGKTTFIVASSTIFLILAVAVFALNFGDPSPDVGTPENGTIVNSTAASNYIDGNFTDTQSTNDVYFTVGRNNPGGVGNELEAFINLTYNITPIHIQGNQILQLIFNISYCTTRDVTAPSTCDGNGAQGTANTMDAEIYNWSSGAYADIGNIADNNDESVATYFVNRSFSDFLSNGLINIRYEANYTLGNGQDAVLSIDYAPLTVKFDNITPVVALNLPANGLNTTANNITTNFTFTDNNATSACSLIINNAVNQTNTSTQNNTVTNFVLNNLANGRYNWSVNCTDIANTGASAIRTFKIDTAPPQVSILLPASNQFFSSNLSIPLNFTVSDSLDYDKVFYNLDNGANTTITGNITFNTSQGTHTLRLFANDTSGNLNSSSVNFTDDLIAPTVTLNLPANNTVNLSASYTFNFTATDNLNTSMICSLLIDGSVNQTNTSMQNNTITNFAVSGFSEGNHTWGARCNDGASTTASASLFFNVSITPVLFSIAASPNPIKGGNVLTITASGADDPNNDTLNFYCDTTETPTAANTDCTGGTTIDTTPPYSLSCTFATAATDTSNLVYCRVYDGESYSTARNTTYTTDSTAPTTTVANVANDSTLPYTDKLNDGSTNITVNGESGMSCRFSTSDIAYSSMTNDCTISGTQALCPVPTVTQGSYTNYVSCQDSLGNEQNSTTNLDTAFTLDYTVPTTTDNSSSAIQTPGYNVTITEADNIDGDPTTLYCTDTTNTCSPNTAIDTGGKVQFSSRGTYYIRYNSTDYAGNQQTTASKTIIINQLPTFTSASGTSGTVKGGSTINITTVSSSADSNQNVTLFVCKTSSATYIGCVSTYCAANATGNATCTFTSETDDTTHTWYAFIFDQSNESAVANPRSGTYTTDSTGPTISILSPANSTYTQSNVTATVTLSEAASNVSYSLDGAANVSMTSISPTTWTIDLTSLSDSSHTLVFYANDTVGNSAAEKNVIFTVNTIPPDTTPPSITVISPVSGTYYTTQSILFNISLNENGTWAGYIIDGGTLTILDNISNRNWNTTLTVVQGSHNITFFANDTSSNRGNTTISFFVDVSAPAYSNVSVAPNPANQSQAVTCSAFWTDTFNITSASVEENATGVFENHTITMTGSNGWTNYTIVGAKLSNVGSYRCNFYTTDAAGNSNSTGTSFTVQDLIAPTITITSPTNTSYSQNDMALQIVSSEPLLTAYYCLDACASNTTMTNTSSTLWQASPTVAGGSHTIKFYGNDTNNNIGNATISFTIDTTLGDTTPPSVTVHSPVNGTYLTNTTALLNISLSENGSWAGYKIGSSSLSNLGNTSNRKWNITLTGLANGVQHNVTFFANDSSANKNTGNTSVIFFVDISAPQFSSISVAPNPANETQTVTCSAFWTDTFNITSASVEENTTGSFVNHSVIVNTATGWTNYTTSSLTKGSYRCNFYTTDAAGNSNSTNTSFTVQDLISPTITITNPLNTTYNTRTLDLNIVTSENIIAANYSLDGTLGNLTGTGKFWSATLSGIADGPHTLIVFGNDTSSNNGNSSAVFTVNTAVLDVTSPILTVRSPINGTYYNASSVVLNITANKNLLWAGYSINGTTVQNLGNTTHRIWNITKTFSDGVYNITFYGNDTSNNLGNTSDNVVYFFVDTTAPQNSSIGFTPLSPNDTSTITCFSTWTDNIALSAGFVEHNISGTFVNSTNTTLGATRGDVNFTFVANSSTPGRVGCRFYAYDNAGLVNVTSFVIMSISDTTVSFLENITYVPNTTAALDPGVRVNITVNVTDNRAVGSVLLNYRLTNETNYTSSPMSSAGGTGYNGSVTLGAGNWTFFINATDTSSNVNSTSLVNLSVALDETWTNSTTISAVKTMTINQRSSNITLGNITINNTGDFDLNFTITSASSGNRVTLNGTANTTLLLNVSYTNSSTFSLEVNTTDLATGIYSYSINITARRNGTPVSSELLNFSIVIQNVAGPYLSTTIDTFSSSVSKGATGITYLARVQNIGTADASGVWLAWTLPSEFTLTSGTLNRTIGALPVGASATNTIVISVNTSINDVNTTINATSMGVDISSSDSKRVKIGNPVTITETVTTVIPGSGGGGSGGSAAAVVEKLLLGEEILSSNETFELVRGYNDSFPIRVKNIFEKTTIYNVSLLIDGYLSRYITISPSFASEIKYNKTKDFVATIVSPEYMDKVTYSLKIIIKGTIIGPGVIKNLTETKNVMLVIHTVSREESTQNLDTARVAIEEMKNAGFPTTKLSGYIDEAATALQAHDYEKASQLSDLIQTTKDDAFLARSLIDEIKNKMSGSLVTGAAVRLKSSTRTEELINLAMAAFEREDYQTAIQRIKDANFTLALESTTFDPVYFVITYWWAMTLGAVFALFFMIFAYRQHVKATITQDILNLAKEENNILHMMKMNQKKHFTSGGVKAFRKTMEQYERRLAEIRQTRIKLRHKRLHLLKPGKIIEDLQKESEEVMELMKQTQQKYFVSVKMSRKTYIDNMKLYNERLAEIEDEKITAETLLATSETPFKQTTLDTVHTTFLKTVVAACKQTLHCDATTFMRWKQSLFHKIIPFLTKFKLPSLLKLKAETSGKSKSPEKHPELKLPSLHLSVPKIHFTIPKVKLPKISMKGLHNLEKEIKYIEKGYVKGATSLEPKMNPVMLKATRVPRQYDYVRAVSWVHHKDPDAIKMRENIMNLRKGIRRMLKW
ncbi:MAG: hypothetical protein AABX14_00980 [Candidatus Aenigmatarchaeota archaeon]